MKRQGGFTLIELVVVIVILGILAVTAAPRFLNIQDDARKATLEGLAGAMQGAAGIVYGKSAIDGIEGNVSGSVSLSGDSIAVVYGYPTATEDNLEKIVTGLASDGDFQRIKEVSSDAPISATYGLPDYTTWCVQYQDATSTAENVISVISGANCANP